MPPSHLQTHMPILFPIRPLFDDLRGTRDAPPHRLARNNCSSNFSGNPIVKSTSRNSSNQLHRLIPVTDGSFFVDLHA